MTLEITLVIVLALLNGFFALSEMALMTSRKIRLKQLATTSRRAKVAYALSQTPEHLLATVQVFITLIGIGTGAALGEKLGDLFTEFFAERRAGADADQRDEHLHGRQQVFRRLRELIGDFRAPARRRHLFEADLARCHQGHFAEREKAVEQRKHDDQRDF